MSTFASAVSLSDEFDYIFCHNEVTVYIYIEEYAPKLFDKIKELVKKGKWHIMGGWYPIKAVYIPKHYRTTGQALTRQEEKAFIEKIKGHRFE